MRQYCTLFDRNYFVKGMLLYESLLKHSSQDFTLHVLACDRWTENALREAKLEKVKIIPLDVFEYQLRLMEVRESRSWKEYLWTLASQFLEDVLRGYREVTYLDADLYFFSDPEQVFAEIGEASIAITPHRFIESKKHLECNGKFNVGWVTIRETAMGLECIRRWAAQTRARCSEYIGCGDQLFLDEWPELYGNHVHVIEHIGVNLAPWNLANYSLRQIPDLQILDVHRLEYGYNPVVFFHLHEFAERADGTFQLTNYELRPEDIRLIYEPYIEAYKAVKEKFSLQTA
jgi:hypothetical protein